MHFLCILCILSNFTLVYAANTPKFVGAKQTAMGGYNATTPDVFALHNNIANTAFTANSKVGLAIDNRYLFANLYNMHFAYSGTYNKIGSFSIGNSFEGYSAYYHHVLRLGYARKFANKFSAGISFQHHYLAIKENGSKHAVSIALGILYKPIDKVHIGVSFKNPIKQKLEKAYNETLESAIQIGLSYHPDDKFNIGLQLVKDLKYPVQIQLGAEYHLHKILFLRAGAAINPTTFSAGLGLQLKNLQLDLASSWNIHLGVSPQISLQYEFPFKKK